MKDSPLLIWGPIVSSMEPAFKDLTSLLVTPVKLLWSGSSRMHLRHMQVKMSWRVYNMIDVRDRVQCLAASVAIYRLFASLLKLAPVRDQHATL